MRRPSGTEVHGGRGPSRTARELTSNAQEGRSGLDAFDGSDPVEVSIERRDSSDARRLGTSDQVGIGEVESVDLKDLDGAIEQVPVDRLDRGVGQHCPHGLGHL